MKPHRITDQQLSSSGPPQEEHRRELAVQGVGNGGRAPFLALAARVHKTVSPGIRKQVNLLHQIDVPARQSISTDYSNYLTLLSTAQRQSAGFSSTTEVRPLSKSQRHLKYINQ